MDDVNYIIHEQKEQVAIVESIFIVVPPRFSDVCYRVLFRFTYNFQKFRCLCCHMIKGLVTELVWGESRSERTDLTSS